MKKIIKRKRLILLIVVLIMVLLPILHRIRVQNELKREANRVVNSLEKGNYSDLVNTQRYSDSVKKKYELISGEKLEFNRYKVIDMICINSKVTYKSSLIENSITFIIDGPDMHECLSKLSKQKKPDNYFKNYLKNGKHNVMKVKMYYLKQNGEWITDYGDNSFKNAVSLGFYEEYGNLYKRYIDGIRKIEK